MIKMKSVLIIGLGRLGHHLCMNMAKLGNEILIVDEDEEQMRDLLQYATLARVGDCTNIEVLKSLGVDNYDLCYVCIGSNFQSSLEITSQLKELGAKYVVSKANRDIQAKFLLRNGADEVIYPDRDVAERLAVRHSANHIFDYIELTEEYSIYEIPPAKSWIGKSILQLDIRNRYHVSIVGVKRQGELTIMPPANRKMEQDDHLMVIGKKEDVDRILEEV